jgi:hypothetical protein
LEIIEEILRALVWQEVTVGAGGDVLWVEVDVEDDGYKGSMDNKD